MPSIDGTEAEVHARISTHILDTVSGEPAADVYVRLVASGAITDPRLF